MYNVAIDASRRVDLMARKRRRRPCKVGLIRHGNMVGYYGRLRLDRRMEASGLMREGSQLGC
jgi:hypothetical protein